MSRNVKKNLIPKFDVPEGFTSKTYLEKIVWDGFEDLCKKYDYVKEDDLYKERLNKELKVINELDAEDYFLIVHDYVKFAKENNIQMSIGWGFANSSLLCFVLGITKIDPIKFDLIFETFVNYKLLKNPYICIIVETGGANTILDYLKKTYGNNNGLRYFGDINRKIVNNYNFVILPEELEIDIPTENVEETINGEIKKEIVISYDKNELEKDGYAIFGILERNRLKDERFFAESVGKSEVDILKLEEYFEKDVFDLISNANSYDIFLIQSDGMIDFLKKLNAEKFEDLVLGFAIYRPGPDKYIDELKKKDKMIETQIWLINDRNNKAGDNGEYFFRYLLKINPKGIDYYFVISKYCYDYERLKEYGHIIDLNSSEYINLFLKADKIISSNSDIKIMNPFGDEGKYIRDLFHFEFIYLQNGIIKDDVSFYLHKIVKNFNLITTSTDKEFNSILNFNYGYNKKNLVITGLARFDNLKRLEKIIKKEKIIAIFPTWRKYIKGTKNLITKESITSESFKNTTFFQFYNKLINNYQLINIMKTYRYKGILCLHPNFAQQYRNFNQNKFFQVKKGCFNKELLIKSSLLITDYSSIFFDFGYIKKPIIYTQFDIDEYRKEHFPKANFEYENDGFGPVCYDMECTINNIILEIENNCELKRIYLKRIKKYFKYIDDKNCFRIYNAIIKGKHKKFNNQIYFISIFIFIVILKKI